VIFLSRASSNPGGTYATMTAWEVYSHPEFDCKIESRMERLSVRPASWYAPTIQGEMMQKNMDARPRGPLPATRD